MSDTQRGAVAGGERVAAPDGGLTQQVDRQQRVGRAPLAHHERNQRNRADGGEHQEARQRAHAHALGLLQGEQQGRDEGHEQHEAHGIEGPGLGAGLTRLEAQGHENGEEAQRQVDEEDRAPAEVLGEKPADDGSEGGGGDRDARKVALEARPLARRDGLADQRLRQRHEAAAAQTLQHAGKAQHLDAGGGGAGERGEEEDAERHEHHALAAPHVAQLPVDRGGDGGGEQIGDDYPGDALDAAERGGNVGERSGDDGLVDHGQEHRQHDGGKDGQEQPAGRGFVWKIVLHASRGRGSDASLYAAEGIAEPAWHRRGLVHKEEISRDPRVERTAKQG